MAYFTCGLFLPDRGIVLLVVVKLGRKYPLDQVHVHMVGKKVSERHMINKGA